MKTTTLILTLAASLAAAAQPVRADDPVVPGPGFPASHYETLWTKSPFAVATAETAQDTSPDYFLVGVTYVEGIYYASVIERQSQEHFLISSDKATRGLRLTSITRSRDGSETFASVQKDGQTISLKLEQAPATTTVAGAFPVAKLPGGNAPQILMPSSGGSPMGSVRPFVPRFHRSTIHPPPPPQPVQSQ